MSMGDTHDLGVVQTWLYSGPGLFNNWCRSSYRGCPLNRICSRIPAQNFGQNSGKEPQVAEDGFVEEGGVVGDVLEGVDLHALTEHGRLPVLLLKKW